MGYATLQKEVATPATPSSGFVRFYAEGSSLKYVDDTGTVYTIATGLTQEDVQDIVAGLLINSSSVTWTYNDASDTLSATVAAGGVNHNALQNYVASQHVDHAAVSIIAGTGLSGGGNLTVSRNISLANTSVVPGTYGSSTESAVLTIDAQGRVTAASNASLAAGSVAVYSVPVQIDNASNTTLTNISDLAVNVVAGKVYKLETMLLYRSAATGTGIAVSYGNTSATGTIAILVNGQVAGDATNAMFTGHITSFSDSVITTATPAANTDFVIKADGLFVCTTSGQIYPQFRSEVNGSTVSVMPGSCLVLRIVQ